MEKFIMAIIPYIIPYINAFTLTVWVVLIFWLGLAFIKLCAKFIIWFYKSRNSALSILIPVLLINISYHWIRSKWRRRFEIVFLWYVMFNIFALLALNPRIMILTDPIPLFRLVFAIATVLTICGVLLVTYRNIKESTTLKRGESKYYIIRSIFFVFLKSTRNLALVYILIISLSMLYATYGIQPFHDYLAYKVNNGWFDMFDYEMQEDWTNDEFYRSLFAKTPNRPFYKGFSPIESWFSGLVVYLFNCAMYCLGTLAPYAQWLVELVAQHLAPMLDRLEWYNLVYEFCESFYPVLVIIMYYGLYGAICYAHPLLLGFFLWLIVRSIYTPIHTHNERKYILNMRRYLRDLYRDHSRDPRVKYLSALEELLEFVENSNKKN